MAWEGKGTDGRTDGRTDHSVIPCLLSPMNDTIFEIWNPNGERAGYSESTACSPLGILGNSSVLLPSLFRVTLAFYFILFSFIFFLVFFFFLVFVLVNGMHSMESSGVFFSWRNFAIYRQRNWDFFGSFSYYFSANSIYFSIFWG